METEGIRIVSWFCPPTMTILATMRSRTSVFPDLRRESSVFSRESISSSVHLGESFPPLSPVITTPSYSLDVRRAEHSAFSYSKSLSSNGIKPPPLARDRSSERPAQRELLLKPLPAADVQLDAQAHA